MYSRPHSQAYSPPPPSTGDPRRPTAENWHRAVAVLPDTPPPDTPPRPAPPRPAPPRQQRPHNKRRGWWLAAITLGIIILASRSACVWYQTDTPSVDNTVKTTPISQRPPLPGTPIQPEAIQRPAAIPTTTPTYEAQKEFQRGIDLHTQRDYHGALQAYQSAQNHLGRPSAALSRRIGLTQLALGDHQRAIDHYTKSIEIQDSAQARALRAISYQAKNQCQLAIQDAQHVLKMEPEPSQATQSYLHQTISICHQQDGQWQMALRHAESALTLLQDNNGDPELIRIAETNVDNLRQMATQ